MNEKLYRIISLTLLVFFSMNENCFSQFTKPGNYDLCFMIQDEELHIPLIIQSDSKWQIINHEERIDLTVKIEMSNNGNSFIAELPYFRTILKGQWQNEYLATGHWEDLSRDSSYWVNFRIVLSSTYEYQPCSQPETKKFKTIFYNSSDTTDALAQFTICGERITGTFMTETGDYRHLHGYVVGNELRFGTFDGAHLYFFKGLLDDENISEGVFLSGNKWRQSWKGIRDENYCLRDPNTIVSASRKRIETLSLKDRYGVSVSISPDFFEGYVTVIELMGTWCPNCLDASRFLDTLTSNLNDSSLRVLPILFERGEDFSKWDIAAKRFFERKKRSMEYYFGGNASKKTASKLFPSLSDIIAFPTLIIVDKDGEIAWVHTGFYGPSTASYYNDNISIIRREIFLLMKE